MKVMLKLTWNKDALHCCQQDALCFLLFVGAGELYRGKCGWIPLCL